MKRKKSGPTHQAVEVFWLRLRDEQTKSDITVRGWVEVRADGTLVPLWDTNHGPGLGPHEFRDLKLGRKAGWAHQQCMDALAAYTGQDDALEDDPQLSLADAPITAGHPATIRIGGI